MAVTGGNEVGQEGHGAVHDPPEVGVHHALNIGELHAQDVTHMHYSGIVDDEVSSAEVRSYLLGIRQHGGTVGDVEMVGPNCGTK
jgi:hypothetical protein